MTEPNGVRGPLGALVTAGFAVDVGRAVGSMAGRVVVGRTDQTVASTLAAGVAAGVREAGSDVVDVGVESTPTVARAVDWYGATAGVAVTTVGDPPVDGQFTFWTKAGRPLDDGETQSLASRLDSPPSPVAPADTGSLKTADDARRRHRTALPDGNLADLSVVVGVRETTDRLTVEALRDLGCSVSTLDGQASRANARGSGLSSAVADGDADLGVAHDGDACGLVAVDDRGRVVGRDELLTLFALEANPDLGAVAAPVSASGLVDAAVESIGCDLLHTPVGDGAMAAVCLAEDVAFAGTASGRWRWPAATLVPDGHMAACQLAGIAAGAGRLSDRIDSFPTFVTERERVRCVDPFAAMVALTVRVRDRYETVTDVDGLRVDTRDGWFLVKASSGEPALELTANARSARKVDALLTEATPVIGEAVRAAESERPGSSAP